MIILLDFSQIVISSAVDLHSKTRTQVELSLLRHIALNNILSYKKKFQASVDQVVICCDGREYWRKSIFPLYKQNRKRDHDESHFDWKTFFEHFNQIKEEIKTELPFRVVEVHRCEADDVIAVLCRQQCPHQDKIIVVSSDKDLLQIQETICAKVQQWSPFHKKFIDAKSNSYSLFDHVIRGDSGDGIPNILSDDDVFMDRGKRSKPIKATSIMEWSNSGGLQRPEKFCSSDLMLDKFKRNHNLIDLRQIPENLAIDIVHEFDSYQKPKVDVFGYLVRHKLRKILESGLL